MKTHLNCPCGEAITGTDEDDLVEKAQKHLSEQHPGRVDQILFIAEHLDQFVGKRRDFALQIGGQFTVDFASGISRQFVAAAKGVLNQTGQFRRRRPAKLHHYRRIVHKRVVLLP